jgi:hypothetical protein
MEGSVHSLILGIGGPYLEGLRKRNVTTGSIAGVPADI